MYALKMKRAQKTKLFSKFTTVLSWFRGMIATFEDHNLDKKGKFQALTSFLNELLG